MPKSCVTLAFICFTLLVLHNSSNSRYLLVELDGSPNMDPGNVALTGKAAIGGPEISKPEEEPIEAMESEPLAEEDEEGALPEQDVEPSNRPLLKSNIDPTQGGYRCSI